MIRVNEDYIIEVGSCYEVKQDIHRTIRKVSIIDHLEVVVPGFVTIGYYDSLTGAIKGIIEDMNRKALSAGEHDLKEAVSIIRENNKRVSELLEKVLEV